MTTVVLIAATHRAARIGYRLAVVTLDETGRRVASYTPFVTWLNDATQTFTGELSAMVSVIGSTQHQQSTCCASCIKQRPPACCMLCAAH
jgi:hypothetical protein